MKSVASSKYDRAYYESGCSRIEYTQPLQEDRFKPIHRHLTSFFPHHPNDFIVDFGCGNGELSFLLTLKYPSRVLGIDYSPDAIQIAREHQHQIQQNTPSACRNLQFQCSSIEKLPELTGVTAIYMGDVIEHLYDEEIDFVLRKFRSWNKGPLRLLLHTDNDRYLRWVRPILDLLLMLMGRASRAQIAERNR